MAAHSSSAAEEEEEEEGDGADEKEDEIDVAIASLSPEEQQKAIIAKSIFLMGVGTIIVLLVSDPMVDVLVELGNRTHIPVFYVSFVLGPLASNVSEVVASFNYAQKKTSKSMRIALATLQGAAVMNNTFCLGIFMILIYTRALSWEFFAETLSILIAQIAMFFMGRKTVHTMKDGLIILSIYPATLILVALLEAVGFD
jgi:Ca2+/Na+ antiporter